MKKIFFITAILLTSAIYANAQQKGAEITFKATTIDLGKFSRDESIQQCNFIFNNTGDTNLFIHQVFTSCGCTVPEYTKEAILPGDSGIIKVTYNGKNKAVGTFRKSITIHTNAKTEAVRLYISGNMTAGEAEKKEE